VIEVSTQGWKIFQRGLENQGKCLGQNLQFIEVNCVINDKNVCCLLDSRTTNSFMTP
jgi:hypothetical protein